MNSSDRKNSRSLAESKGYDRRYKSFGNTETDYCTNKNKIAGKLPFNLGESARMEFWLHYEGPLPATSQQIVKVKHQIRKHLHPQLLEFWKIHMTTAKRYEPIRLGDFAFQPIVRKALKMVCQLDILFLRRDDPGALFTKPRDSYGGDIDNRLKVFFDCLRVPQNENEIKNLKPAENEKPFYCLLQDDALITKFQIDTGRLLDPLTDDTSRMNVRLNVKVTTRLTELDIDNFRFWSG